MPRFQIRRMYGYMSPCFVAQAILAGREMKNSSNVDDGASDMVESHTQGEPDSNLDYSY